MATPIYHITNIENLPSIIAEGGLNSLNVLRLNTTQYSNIAYDSVQDRRATTPVPCGRRGMLHDYVPFYWAPRSPMLFAINRGLVPACTNGQKDVIYLVSNVESVAAASLDFVFTDGHGIMATSQFFDDLAHLDKIDWPLMKSRYWNDTNEDGDRKRRRQAEFLVYNFFPFSLLRGIGVRLQSDIARVTSRLGAVAGQLEVRSVPAWYY